MAVTPRYQTHGESQLAYGKFLAEVLAKKETLLQGKKLLPNHRGTNSRLSRLMAELAGQKEMAGITVKQVMTTLAKSKGQFPVVFFDVNELNVKGELDTKVAYPNVGTVFYVNKAVPYDLIEYDELFSYIGVTATDFEVRLREVLRTQLPK